MLRMSLSWGLGLFYFFSFKKKKCINEKHVCRKRWEGLVHVSELRKEGRIADVSTVVSRAQKVRVKVLSMTGTKASLSMKVGPSRRRERAIQKNFDRAGNVVPGRRPRNRRGPESQPQEEL